MKKTLIIKTVNEMIQWRSHIKNQTVGFVPTMGALHTGHTSLLQQCHLENDLTILSIFVNPTQFNNHEDLQNYPQTFDHDYHLACESGVDVLFYPQFSEIYPDQYRFKVIETEFSRLLCGAHRPGHFDGVLSVVMKLFHITRAHKSYFGMKDYQQYNLIKSMANAFFLETQVIGLPTIREESGLAKSSRNMRLSDEGKIKAALIYKTISSIKDINQAKVTLQQSGFEVEYLEDIDNRRYIAAYLEGIRLIDNVEIS